MDIQKPIEYINGFTKFLNCRIDLSLKIFIPEPETAFWVKKAIKDIKSSRLPAQILRSKIWAGRSNNNFVYCLDIFAGSGCIGIALLKHIKNSRVDFVDVDKKALQQIKINLTINKISPKRYQIIQSDIFQKVRSRYDYILTNPPYVALKRKHWVQNSVLNFEPAKAIFGGDDGLLFIRKFLRQAKRHLKKSGKIYFEFDHFHKKELEELLGQLNYKNFQFFKDQYHKWRWCVLSNFKIKS